MSAALKLDPGNDQLRQKPPLGEKRPKPRLVWDNPNLSAGKHKGKPKVKPDASYGRVVYNYFRTYDASTGRYIESDPIGLGGGLNTFLYANGNPSRFIDPNGQNPLCPFLIAVDGPALFGDAACLCLVAATAFAASQAGSAIIDALNETGASDNVIPFPQPPNCGNNGGGGDSGSSPQSCGEDGDCIFTGLAGVVLKGSYGMTIQCQYSCPKKGLKINSFDIGFRSENPAFLCPRTLPESTF